MEQSKMGGVLRYFTYVFEKKKKKKISSDFTPILFKP